MVSAAERGIYAALAGLPPAPGEGGLRDALQQARAPPAPCCSHHRTPCLS